MNSLDLQQQIGGVSTLMNRIMKATKECCKMSSNDNVFVDICFVGLKKEEETMSEGVDYCRSAKKSHEVFCLSTLENLMKE